MALCLAVSAAKRNNKVMNIFQWRARTLWLSLTIHPTVGCCHFTRRSPHPHLPVRNRPPRLIGIALTWFTQIFFAGQSLLAWYLIFMCQREIKKALEIQARHPRLNVWWKHKQEGRAGRRAPQHRYSISAQKWTNSNAAAKTPVCAINLVGFFWGVRGVAYSPLTLEK